MQGAEEEGAGDVGGGGDNVGERAGGLSGDVPISEGVAAGAKDSDVGVHTDNAIFKFAFEACHDGKHDDQGGDADGNAQDGDEGEEGDEAFVATRAYEVAEGGKEFEVHYVVKVGVISYNWDIIATQQRGVKSRCITTC